MIFYFLDLLTQLKMFINTLNLNIFQLEDTLPVPDFPLEQGSSSSGQEHSVGRRRRGEEVDRQLRKEQW